MFLYTSCTFISNFIRLGKVPIICKAFHVVWAVDVTSHKIVKNVWYISSTSHASACTDICGCLHLLQRLMEMMPLICNSKVFILMMLSANIDGLVFALFLNVCGVQFETVCRKLALHPLLCSLKQNPICTQQIWLRCFQSLRSFN